ncbi:hypothetical protein [Bacillus pumilus]|nr:hypothetical protein [Bacillus pumilus]
MLYYSKERVFYNEIVLFECDGGGDVIYGVGILKGEMGYGDWVWGFDTWV